MAAIDFNAANLQRLRRNAQRTKQPVFNETPTGVIDGANKIFTLAHVPVLGTEQIFLNGLLKVPTTDYTISGATVTFVTAPAIASTLRAHYWR